MYFFNSIFLNSYIIITGFLQYVTKYKVECETKNKTSIRWIDLEYLGNYLDLIEEFETKDQDDYTILLNNLGTQNTNIEDFKQLNTLDITEDQIIKYELSKFTIQQSINQEFNYNNNPQEINPQVELNKELKAITKTFSKGGNKAAFNENQISKIITYAPDELEQGKYQFLVQWKLKPGQKKNLANWVTEEKMKLYAYEYLQKYGESKGVNFN